MTVKPGNLGLLHQDGVILAWDNDGTPDLICDDVVIGGPYLLVAVGGTVPTALEHWDSAYWASFVLDAVCEYQRFLAETAYDSSGDPVTVATRIGWTAGSDKFYKPIIHVQNFFNETFGLPRRLAIKLNPFVGYNRVSLTIRAAHLWTDPDGNNYGSVDPPTDPAAQYTISAWVGSSLDWTIPEEGVSTKTGTLPFLEYATQAAAGLTSSHDIGVIGWNNATDEITLS